MKKVLLMLLMLVSFATGCIKEVEIIGKYEIESAALRSGSATPGRFFYSKDGNDYYIDEVKKYVSIHDKSEVHEEKGPGTSSGYSVFLTKEKYRELYGTEE